LGVVDIAGLPRLRSASRAALAQRSERHVRRIEPGLVGGAAARAARAERGRAEL